MTLGSSLAISPSFTGIILENYPGSFLKFSLKLRCIFPKIFPKLLQIYPRKLHMRNSCRHVPEIFSILYLRGWSDKYLSSPPDGVTIARRVCYRVEPSCRRLTSKFQSNRICGFVLTPCRSERVHRF